MWIKKVDIGIGLFIDGNKLKFKGWKKVMVQESKYNCRISIFEKIRGDGIQKINGGIGFSCDLTFQSNFIQKGR